LEEEQRPQAFHAALRQVSLGGGGGGDQRG
jgi:hypothetical protein